MANEKDSLLVAQACNRDVPDDPPSAKQDCRDVVNISVFFDGTGNNENDDVGDKKWSNVARMRRASNEFAAQNRSANSYPIYISGVGTTFNGKSISAYDSQVIASEDGTTGLIAGSGGDRRLLLGNNNVNDTLRQVLIANAKARGGEVKVYAEKGQSQSFADLGKALASHKLIKVINLSIFGFSRGAALARAFSNQFISDCKKLEDGSLTYNGYPVRIHFMGLFDTVASFGVPSGNVDMPWAEKNLVLSHQHVEMAVHYVAAHELRFSFPVDLIRKNGMLKKGWIETVYPGVHSDVGGGYRPVSGAESQGIDINFARIPMKDMMREATIHGVRMLSYDGVDAVNAPLFDLMFKVRPEIRSAYQAYVGSVNCGTTIESSVRHHMEALYSAYGTLYRAGTKTPGHHWYRSMGLEVTTYRAAIKAMKATAGKLPAVTLASGVYAIAVQPQKWMLDAFDKTASAAVLNFIRDNVHDSKAGFLEGLEPFTYFRPRGMAESSRNVLAHGLQWLDEGVTAVETGVIEIYHTTEGIVSEKWFQGKLLAKKTYQVGEKFTVDAYHAGQKCVVETYDSGKQVVIETVDAGQQFVVSSYNSASKAVDDFVGKTKAKVKALEKTAESAAKKVFQNAEDLLQEGVKDVQDGWNANRAWLGL